VLFICTFKHLYLGNHSEIDTCAYEFFFTMTYAITSQNSDLSFESPCR